MRLQGANFSGKSIYLKQIALITYMAHLGSPPLTPDLYMNPSTDSYPR